MIAYILTSGVHDDYHIEGVVTNWEDAKKLAEKFDFNIEEYIVGDITYTGFEYMIMMDKTGKILSIDIYPIDIINFEPEVYFNDLYSSGLITNFVLYFSEKNERKAVSEASKYFQMLKDNNLLGKDKEANKMLFGFDGVRL